MAHYMLAVDFEGVSAYPATDAPNFTIPFEPRTMRFINEGGAASVIAVSFNGVDDHLFVTVGLDNPVVKKERSKRIWAREVTTGAAGTNKLRLSADDAQEM